MKYTDEQIEKANQDYQAYLTDHINNVLNGFQWLLDKGIVKDDSGVLMQQLKEHDLSKYEIDEWDAYRNYFNLNGSELEFNYAWLHHIHNNKHHWQYWVLINDDNNFNMESKVVALKMPKQYVVEMICDWWAFSWKKGDLKEIFNWYEKNKDNILLHEETRKDVEDLLEIIKNELN